VFRNDPAQVAGAFHGLLVGGRFEGCFEEVVFAVLDRTPGTTTRAAFEQTFAEVCTPPSPALSSSRSAPAAGGPRG
jgi:hypothetical protein